MSRKVESVERYSRLFSLAALRLSKSLAGIAQEVFTKTNRFVKVTMSFPQLTDALGNFDVPYFSGKSLNTFKGFVASVQIKVQNPNVSRTPNAVVAIISEDIPLFCRFLRLVDHTNFLIFYFHFTLHVSLTPAQQALFLSPFEAVDVGAGVQRVDFGPGFDSGLKLKIKRSMTQPVGWVRLVAWQIFHLAQDIKNIADQAYLAGDLDFAYFKYDQAGEWIHHVRSLFRTLKLGSQAEHHD